MTVSMWAHTNDDNIGCHRIGSTPFRAFEAVISERLFWITDCPQQNYYCGISRTRNKKSVRVGH